MTIKELIEAYDKCIQGKTPYDFSPLRRYCVQELQYHAKGEYLNTVITNIVYYIDNQANGFLEEQIDLIR